MFSANDQTPTCRADQKSRSKVVSNKTLVGGLEAGKFSFVGVVRYCFLYSRTPLTRTTKGNVKQFELERVFEFAELPLNFRYPLNN